MTALSHHASAMLARAADSPAIAFDGHWFRWGELRATADVLMTALDETGLPRNAQVALVARNHPSAIAALIALIARNASIRMIYPFQSGVALARNLEDLETGAAILHAQDYTVEVRDALARAGMAAILLDGMAVHAETLPSSDRRSADGPSAPRIDILTSGTTGPPKPFAIPFSLMEAHFISTPLTRHQGTDPASAPPFLLYFPLGNISGLYATLPTLIRGQRAVLVERFSIEAWHAYVLRYRPSHSGVPPSSVRQILEANIPKADLSSIKAMGIGAAPLDPAVQRAFEERYAIPILLSYGATEFAGPVAMMTLDLHAAWGEAKFGSVGRALQGVRLQVVDPETLAPLPAGQTGLLQVVSPRIGTDWILTADLAMLDADGFLFLNGRADGAINRGGFKIVPETIEATLRLHPDVADAAVIGVADERLGEVPAAAICCSPGHAPPDAGDLALHLRQHLPATHIPVLWQVVIDFPRTPSMKIDRRAIRQSFETGRFTPPEN